MVSWKSLVELKRPFDQGSAFADREEFLAEKQQIVIISSVGIWGGCFSGEVSSVSILFVRKN